MKKYQDEGNKKKEEKLIDILHKAIKDAGIKIKRDGWIEAEHNNPPNDRCEWLDVLLEGVDNDRRITVHFYFTHNSTKLEQLSVFEEEKKISYSDIKRITKLT